MNDEQTTAQPGLQVDKAGSEAHVDQLTPQSGTGPASNQPDRNAATDVLGNSYNRTDYETGAVDEATLAEQNQPRAADPAAEAEAEVNPS